MLTSVGDDHMGSFLVESLDKEGCDTRAIKVDSERLIAIVLLGIKDHETFPLMFYRENCADMTLREEDIDESFMLLLPMRRLALTFSAYYRVSIWWSALKKSS
ncbi:hypothetical protein GCM10009425_25080 [Pseudomonas asuensis]|uniref:Carbohydrate kinase PfkB domain-containing protein n=1 Tax=Pseudomonas asuensis TaxID=1825787 RepID=A0ABQ2GVM9_9PSED|nr:hypothetical protein GCM10009425_25080 [Pseudomonas asuensis]